MGPAAKSALAFLLGFVAGYGLSILGYVVATTLGGVMDRDGGLAMAVAFMVGPAAAVLCGVAAAIWMIRRAN
jgi:hypothetical protein